MTPDAMNSRIAEFLKKYESLLFRAISIVGLGASLAGLLRAVQEILH
jgi:hypothetical protein